jgi:23S rRNA pseudouridine1911/1915/1917 synthase
MPVCAPCGTWAGFRLEGSFEKGFIERVSLRIPAREDFEVLRENDDWLVVGKPAPLIMHPTGKFDEVTLLGVLKRAMAGVEFFFVNRLDRETSGCVLVAKSSGVARRLGRMMERREIRKGYEAIVRGWPEWDDLTVEARLRRRGGFEESEVWVRQGVNEGGKECATCFEVKERFEREEGKFALIGCEPKTGRTHQIRVHLAWAGFPMVGDKIYGGDERAYLDFLKDGWTSGLRERLILDRQALHARWMEFEWEGEAVRVDCEMPEELTGFCVA